MILCGYKYKAPKYGNKINDQGNKFNKKNKKFKVLNDNKNLNRQ